MAHHLPGPHRLGTLGEARTRSEPRDAVVIGPQQLSHRGQLACAQPPALGIGGAHPSTQLGTIDPSGSVPFASARLKDGSRAGPRCA